MADIKFKAFVEDWTKNNSQHPDWAMKTAETHRKKDGDNWVTSSRTFRTVKAGYDDNNQPLAIDFTRFAKGTQVEVIGREMTEVRDHEGKKYYDLVVKATSVVAVERDGQQNTPTAAPAPAQTAAPEAWATTPDSELPF
jgi:hypothetical protein